MRKKSMYSQTRVPRLEEGRWKKLPGRKVSWLCKDSLKEERYRDKPAEKSVPKSTSSPVPLMELEILNSTIYFLFANIYKYAYI